MNMKDFNDCCEVSIFKKINKIFSTWEDFIEQDV